MSTCRWTADNLGYQWNDSPEDTPFRYIALDRLSAVVRRHAKAAGVPMDQVTVEVDFFHPDSQPAGPEWQGNAFFEGMSHSLLPDGSESLIATLWSDNGGQISVATQWPLDAGKKGLRAIEPFTRVDEVAQAEADALWTVGNDLAAMLRRKTELLADRAEGASYNALYKHMKLSHIVVGTKDGKPAALTAEEVIAHQLANGTAAALPLDDAKLVTLSPDVLRTMLGETGDQGVARFFADEYLLNPDLVSPYTGINETMLARFGAGWTAEVGSIGQTSLAHVGAQRALTVRTMLTDEERNSRQDRIDYLNNRAADVGAKRHRRLEKAEVRKGYLAALQLASGSITAERSTFDFPDLPHRAAQHHRGQPQQAAARGDARHRERRQLPAGLRGRRPGQRRLPRWPADRGVVRPGPRPRAPRRQGRPGRGPARHLRAARAHLRAGRGPDGEGAEPPRHLRRDHRARLRQRRWRPALLRRRATCRAAATPRCAGPSTCGPRSSSR